MILDKISNYEKYRDYNPNVYTALKWLVETDLEALPLGPIAIDGENARGGCSEYETKEDRDSVNWEAHKKYIDIWATANGKAEYFGCRKLDGLEVLTPYSEEKDVMFFPVTQDGSLVRLEPGYFAILDTDDAHRGAFTTEKGVETIKKIVLKAKKV